MPDEPVAEFFTHYDYAPEVQGWLLSGQSITGAQSLESITEGRFFQRGPNIYRSGTSEYVGRVAFVRGATVEVGTGGTVLLNNAVPRSRVDDPLAPNRQPRLVVTGDISHLGDTVERALNRTISLAPRGELIYVDDNIASGKQRYSKQIAPFPGEPVPQRLVTGWRLATSEELIIRGVAGYLARNASAAMNAFKLGGFTKADGTTTTNGSEIVQAIAATLDVQPLITYILQSEA